MVTRGFSSRSFACVLAAFSLSACSESEFAASSKKKKEPSYEAAVPFEKTLSLACDPKAGKAELVTEMSAKGEATVRIKGEFCGLEKVKKEGSLTVLFLVDFSGSMGDNDPLVANSCGRLKAAQAIVDKLSTSAAEGVSIELASLAFADDALPPVGPYDLETFKSHLTPEAICQDNDGGTNYEAAFVGARELLKSKSGTKVVYFISDGLPTRAGTSLDPGGIFGSFGSTPGLDDVYKAGRDAAQSLLSQVEDVTLNAIYIAPPQPDPLFGSFPGAVDPEVYLREITGSAERVKLVDNADSLASEIVTFETPEIQALDKDSVRGTHKSDRKGDRPVKLAKLEKDPSREGVWLFESEPVKLVGAKGERILNEITFVIESDSGETITARAVIRYEQGT